MRMSSTRMVRLDSRRLLRVVGEDKGSILQGLVTNDLTSSQSVQYAMLLNPQVQRLRACVRACVRTCVCTCVHSGCVHVYTCMPVFAGWRTTNTFACFLSSSPLPPSQGKVLYEILVYKEVPGHPDQWLLECCSEVQADLVKHLQKYILRAKVGKGEGEERGVAEEQVAMSSIMVT